jgi:predicted CXXCH cytochrome family protein
MMKALRICIAGFLLATTAAVMSQTDAGYTAGGTQQCVSCHDFGPESPVHAVMAGSHGDAGDKAGRRGCEDCHGPSANHAGAPTQVSPGVSFGPRWTNTVAAQDSKCLACHEENVAKHWKDSLHMVNDLTCVTCHDVHTETDQVLTRKQAQVCTVCHKAQKQGIHGLQKLVKRNPECSLCHNPHDHESAETEMLKNRSEGCSTCHNLVKMADDDKVSDKARSYHKVMASPERTCIECHSGIAHAATDSVTSFAPLPGNSKEVTLFYPGTTTAEWLVENHPGSQPLRQGSGCQQCHRGEEAAMGQALAGEIQPASRKIQVTFGRDADSLRIKLRWQGGRNEKALSLMLGKDGNDAFRRGGCFAACHNDMTGMPGNRGQQTDKYLLASRSQQSQIGRPAIVKDQAALTEMMEQGKFVIMWHVDLHSGTARTATLLDKVNWRSEPAFRASTSYTNGWWQVDLRRSLHHDSSHVLPFDPEGQYTFGIAINGADNAGGGHWVSLPLTVRSSGKDSDFKVE